MSKRPADEGAVSKGAKSTKARLFSLPSPTPSSINDTISASDRAGLSLLCCLPDGLLRQAVLPFLKVEEIVQLDSATCICVPVDRARLLSELAGTVLDGGCSTGAFNLHRASMAWLLRRRVAVRSATIDKCCSNAGIDSCVERFGAEAVSVVLAPLESLDVLRGEIIEKILRHCKNLRSFQHYGAGGEEAGEEAGEESCRSALAAMAEYCTGLHTLVVYFTRYFNNPPFFIESVMEVAQSNPGLTVLDMRMSTCNITEAQMVALWQQCRGLTEVGFPRETTFAAASASLPRSGYTAPAQVQGRDRGCTGHAGKASAGAYESYCLSLPSTYRCSDPGSGAELCRNEEFESGWVRGRHRGVHGLARTQLQRLKVAEGNRAPEANGAADDRRVRRVGQSTAASMPAADVFPGWEVQLAAG
ncbi:hypothetical protein B484DRAFT_454249 [Ochromonadaceae sp. CCMP2298]|nr:hypothetical protein B484DRAFT_454249 [Ochromonadaceae sp. CCMP2298]